MNRMKLTGKSYRGGIAISTLALALAYAGAAHAQSAPTTGGATTAEEQAEIVVTGTLLRNTAAVGTSTIAITPATIQGTGAISTDQMLATIPQLSSFGQLQTANQGGTQITVNRINLRNLPQGTGGSSPTLVLLDGHRMVSVGVKQAYPDPDVIPPDLIERVEVVPDGGSAIYGSDAVGGVVNFVTKKNFDGLKFGIRQGFADNYSSTDINLTAGKSWSTGSVYVGYNYAWHGSLRGADRDYVRNTDYATGLPADLSCSPANVKVSGSNSVYAVVGNSLVQSNANRCDSTKTADFYPEERRHSVMGGFRQELGDSVEFQLKAYYAQRTDLSNGGPLRDTQTVTSANPNYISIGAGDPGSQQVSYNYGPVGGLGTVSTRLWSYGITPSVTWKINRDWQLRATYNYGQSQTTAIDPAINPSAVSAAVATGAINPYNIAASNPAAIAKALDFANYGIGKDEMSNAKVVVDGPLFRLPGGDLKVAVGGEYLHEKYRGLLVNNTYEFAHSAPFSPASRNVWSAFGELNVPVIGPDNNIPLVNSLTLSGAVRYDHYSDFGGNWAPNFAATWKVVDWISLRGRWNRSFQAPSLVQLSQASQPTATVFPAIFASFVPLLLNPAVPFNGGPIVAVQGTVSPLQPQKARIYDLGFDIRPPIAPGLGLHFTYYNIDYRGSISTPPLGSGPFYNVPGFASSYTMLPNTAQIQSRLAGAGVSQSDINNVLAQVAAQGGNAYVVADIRSRNLGVALIKGYDFGLDYAHDMPFGSIDASFNGTYTLNTTTAADGTNFLPNQADVNQPRFTSVGRLGANVGDNFRGQLSWTHRSGFNLSTPAGLGQMTVGSFDTIDLFLKYDVKRSDMLPMALTLGINNIFDQNPPVYYGNSGPLGGSGYANGSTVGRFVQLGLTVNF
ncbi:MAG TPA: TonB-dependent receptor [Sphingobium sp.]|uniref:TonB-dependent receptor plug domain-containing protein n=1 Tax=Sphingobium sp. TaxID=1912891 RepID=UPI002ED340BF